MFYSHVENTNMTTSFHREPMARYAKLVELRHFFIEMPAPSNTSICVLGRDNDFLLDF